MASGILQPAGPARTDEAMITMSSKTSLALGL